MSATCVAEVAFSGVLSSLTRRNLGKRKAMPLLGSTRPIAAYFKANKFTKFGSLHVHFYISQYYLTVRFESCALTL